MTPHRTTECNTVQQHALKDNTPPYITTRLNTTQHNPISHHNTTQHNTSQNSPNQYNVILRNSSQHIKHTTKHTSTQQNQHYTMQYTTIPYNTRPHNTLQLQNKHCIKQREQTNESYQKYNTHNTTKRKPQHIAIQRYAW